MNARHARAALVGLVLMTLCLAATSCGPRSGLELAADLGVEVKRSAERTMVACYRLHADGGIDDEQLAAAENAYLRVRAALVAYADALATVEAADAALGDPLNQQRLDALRAELLRTAADLAAFALVGRETCPLMQP